MIMVVSKLNRLFVDTEYVRSKWDLCVSNCVQYIQITASVPQFLIDFLIIEHCLDTY